MNELNELSTTEIKSVIDEDEKELSSIAKKLDKLREKEVKFFDRSEFLEKRLDYFKKHLEKLGGDE
jgi:DNA anti-recombination protein RmuC